MKKTEEDLKKDLEQYKKLREELERKEKLKNQIKEEKKRIKEFSPSFFSKIINR